MSHNLIPILLLLSLSASSQKKWDGGGGNNLWSNATNWSGNTLPTTTDNVVLDNSLVTTSYTVMLPSTAVTVRTITITPAASRTVTLTLPASNVSVPGLTCSGPGYGLTINSGGIFKNSSGSTSGGTVLVSDSIRINNDGKYIHNTQSSHAGNVQLLSRAPGTELGVMELDIPAASSTISLSGRTYGKLVLRATAAGGTCNYTAAGTSKVIIRNSLELGAGVNLNLNCSDTIAVGAHLIQDVGGTLNLGNSTRSVVLSVQQTINTSGTITETGTGTQTLLANGSGLQMIFVRGSITNQVTFAKDGNALALCRTTVSLPYKLKLKKGVIKTDGLMTLQSGCGIEADTLDGTTYIEGPLKKDGLSNQAFLFPVGSSGSMRWLQLQNATGDFTVEYVKSDPNVLSTTKGSGLHHISKVEYWNITTTSALSATVKLSFVDPHSGGVTDLSSLRVARLINGIWVDAGNTAVAGTPGSDGWVSSSAASGFSADTKSFALASAMGQENPLPISRVSLEAIRNTNSILLRWKAEDEMKVRRFALQRSFDGTKYTTVYSVQTQSERQTYSYRLNHDRVKAFYRVLAWAEDDLKEYISHCLHIPGEDEKVLAILGSNMVSHRLLLTMPKAVKRAYAIAIYDASGRLVQRHNCIPTDGGIVTLNVSRLKAGIYFVKGADANGIKSLRFVRM